MANSPQATKRARQNVTRRGRLSSARAAMRTHVKKLIAACEQNQDQEQLKARFQRAQALLDRAACRKVLHPNKVARIKSRLIARIKAQAAKVSAS